MKLDKEVEELLAKANVHRIGRGIKKVKGKPTGEEAWIITVTQKVSLSELASEDVVPTKFKSLVTDVVEDKMAKFLKARTEDWRPAPGGVSIAHYKVTAGTLSCIVHKDRQPMILSNNHILANLNDCKIGDIILQRAKADGGEVGKQDIAFLHSFIPVTSGGVSFCPFARGLVKVCNFLSKLLGRNTRLVALSESEPNIVDCALAKPKRVNDVDETILEIGEITGEGEPRLEMPVKKSGRTSGLTYGFIDEVDVTAKVTMGSGKIATFTDQFSIISLNGKFSEPGDSGSLIVSEDNRAIGLLFAGSETQTIANRWSNVKEVLELD